MKLTLEQARIAIIKLRTIVDIEIDGIDHKDYPDYVDAFISSANWSDGTELNEDELEELNEDREFVYNELFKHIV